jgi:hypothetical protein
MQTANETPAKIQAEVIRRHKSTRTTILSLLVAVVLLSILASVSQKFVTPRSTSSLQMSVLITIMVFGLGAIAFRRTRFATMRLQDIAGLRGASGLLIFLQRTTLQVALIGITIAVIGFVAALLIGEPAISYRGGVVAAAVMLYCYPVRRSWEQAVRRFAPENGPNLSENPT